MVSSALSPGASSRQPPGLPGLGGSAGTSSCSTWARGTASRVAGSLPRPSGKSCLHSKKPLDSPTQKKRGQCQGDVMGDASQSTSRTDYGARRMRACGRGSKESEDLVPLGQPWGLCGLRTFKDQGVHRPPFLRHQPSLQLLRVFSGWHLWVQVDQGHGEWCPPSPGAVQQGSPAAAPRHTPVRGVQGVLGVRGRCAHLRALWVGRGPAETAVQTD